MGRPVGLPKTGGREKGTLNKRSRDLRLLLESCEFCPIQKILEDMVHLEPRDRIAVCMKLMEFLYPKKKQQEFSLSDSW